MRLLSESERKKLQEKLFLASAEYAHAIAATILPHAPELESALVEQCVATKQRIQEIINEAFA